MKRKEVKYRVVEKVVVSFTVKVKIQERPSNFPLTIFVIYQKILTPPPLRGSCRLDCQSFVPSDANRASKLCYGSREKTSVFCFSVKVFMHVIYV